MVDCWAWLGNAQSRLLLVLVMTIIAFDAAGAEVFDQGTKGQNWQGSIKKITENNNINEQIPGQSSAESNTNCDDDDKKYKDFHDHSGALLAGNQSNTA